MYEGAQGKEQVVPRQQAHHVDVAPMRAARGQHHLTPALLVSGWWRGALHTAGPGHTVRVRFRLRHRLEKPPKRTARRAADPLHLLRTIVKSGTRGAKEVASSFTKAPHSRWCAAERCQCDGWRHHGYPRVGGAKNERSAEQQCFLQPATPPLHVLPAKRNDKDSRESLPHLKCLKWM